MSGKVVGWAFEQDCRTPAAKLILVKLADNANEDGYCWPSVPLVVKHTGLSDRAVRENLRHLEADGLIRINQRITSKGQRSNAYQLSVPSHDRASPPPAAGAGPGLQQVQGVGAAGAGTPCSRCSPIVRTVNEPSLNLPPPINGGDNARGLEARVAKLSRALGDDVFKAWFEEACFEDGSPVTIIFPRPFQVNWVRNHFASTIARIFGDDTKVEVLGKRELPAGQNQTATATPASGSGGASDPWWNKEAGDGAEAA